MISKNFFDPLVYCGSGTETAISITNIVNFSILWSTAEAVLRQFLMMNIKIKYDPLVYCGSGTETVKIIVIIIFK